MPEGARYVGRGSRWGNPFRTVDGNVVARPWEAIAKRRMDETVCAYVYDELVYSSHSSTLGAKTHAVDLFRTFCSVRARDTPREFERWIAPLRGLDLACWCPPGHPCHAYVLLGVSNA